MQAVGGQSGRKPVRTRGKPTASSQLVAGEIAFYSINPNGSISMRSVNCEVRASWSSVSTVNYEAWALRGAPNTVKYEA